MREADLADFLAYQRRPETLRYTPNEPLAEERARNFLARQAAVEMGDEGGYIAFAVHHKSDDKIIGEISLNVLPKARSRGEIGWSLHPDYWRQGYATEAARVCLAYGFEDLNLHRVTTFCDARNQASYRLMERLGMRREGLFRRSGFTEGAWRDEFFYALLRDEWLAAAGEALPDDGADDGIDDSKPDGLEKSDGKQR